MNDKIDDHIPFELLHTQVWMGELIGKPLINQKINPLTPSGLPVEEEAENWIKPSAQLKPHQRIEIYNQQYWIRLLKILGEIYPTLLRFFGKYAFEDKIGIPYLACHPPKSWLINQIGDELPFWVEQCYEQSDRLLVSTFAQADLAIEIACRECSLRQPFLNENPADLLSRKVVFQPYVFLFSLPWDIFTFRKTFLEHDEEYWQNHTYPPLYQEKTYSYLVYRTPELKIHAEILEKEEFMFLSSLKEGLSIEEVCEKFEASYYYKKMETSLSDWMLSWISNKLFIFR